MDIWSDTNWYAIQTKPSREKLAAASVGQLDLEVFFPRAKQEESICGAKRLSIKPLFTGYFFARFCPLLSFDAVRYAKGVLRVVGTSRSLLPVEQALIASIQERAQADGLVYLEAQPLIPGDKVLVEQGPLQGLMGRIEREWNDGKRVLILLEAMEYARVLIDKRCLTIGTAQTQSPKS